ncbi:MAG: inositol monophosphatase [Bacteroidetes bacterium]|nr:MAG: inositol monophosphatase [Bacteroidota bacterium]
MKKEELATILTAVEAIALRTGRFILEQRQAVSADMIETKSLNSLVSYVDKEAEKMIIAALKDLVPGAGFIAEEGTVTKRGEQYNWIIDPLDGTTNFLYDVPVFAVSIALASAEAIEVGVVYECGRDELFSAYRGGGAYLNGKVMSVAKQDTVKESLLATGFPYYDFERMQSFNALLAKLYPNSRGLRRMGSAATDLAYVACGRFNAYFEYGLSPWDVAAGILLVQEAGGKVSDFKGGDNYLFSAEIIASSSKIYDEFLGLLQEHLPSKA